VDAKVYRERLGKRAKDIISFGMNLRVKKGVAHCPYHKDDTPSFSWYDEGLFWKCFGCGEKVDIYRYLQDYKGTTFQGALKEVAGMTGGGHELEVKRKEYKKPQITTSELSKEAIEYMSFRKISEQTLKDWKVTQKNWNGKECYVFSYYNTDNELEYVSYREIGKGKKVLKGGCEADTKPILWGMWHIDTDKPLVITEGQPDAMAIWESGYKNVVSVPSGSNNLTWIDNCWDFLEQIQEIIIFGDNDEPGLKMINEVCARLGKYRTKVVCHKHKDANEVLYYDGADAVLSAINSTIKQTPRGILSISDCQYVSPRERLETGIPTGYYGIDSNIDDLQPQQLTLLVGRSGEGKSTVLSQMLCNFIEYGAPSFLYSGELSNSRIKSWLYKQAVGNNLKYLNTITTKYGTKKDIRKEAIRAIDKWCEGKLFVYDKSVSDVRKNADELFDVMSMSIKRYGCKIIVIDNLMSAMEEHADSINADQSNFVQRCKDFVESYNVHIILAVHPNKTKTRGQRLEKEDISGSNNIPNKADNTISIERNFDSGRDCDAMLRLLKEREEGRYTEVKLLYQDQSKRLVEMTQSGFLSEPKYTWEKYLEDIAEQQEFVLPF
jgi:twinkle protein